MTAVLAILTVDGDSGALLAAYDRAMPAIQARAVHYGSPQLHACARTDTGITIVDVWESEESFGRFVEHPEFARPRREAGRPDPSAVQVLRVHAAGWPQAECLQPA